MKRAAAVLLAWSRARSATFDDGHTVTDYALEDAPDV